MESLLPFLQGTCTPYNMPVYPGAQCIIANALNKEPISTDMSASVHKSSPVGRKTGYSDNARKVAFPDK